MGQVGRSFRRIPLHYPGAGESGRSRGVAGSLAVNHLIRNDLTIQCGGEEEGEPQIGMGCAEGGQEEAVKSPTMKTTLMAAVAAAALTATSGLAVDTLYVTDGPGSTLGGEFNAHTSAHGTFVTFCLETLEGIRISTYPNEFKFAYEISDAAKWNGIGIADPISLSTAWLYDQFLNGTLAGYNYGVGRTASANALQQAIWYLEGEIGGSNAGLAGTFIANADAALLGLGYANELAAANGAFGVRVLNMYGLTSTGELKARDPKQDLLIRVRVPDSGTTLLMMGLGLAAVGAARRRLC